MLYRLSETGLLTNLEDGRQLIDLDSAQWVKIPSELAFLVLYTAFCRIMSATKISHVLVV